MIQIARQTAQVSKPARRNTKEKNAKPHSSKFIGDISYSSGTLYKSTPEGMNCTRRSVPREELTSRRLHNCPQLDNQDFFHSETTTAALTTAIQRAIRWYKTWLIMSRARELEVCAMLGLAGSALFGRLKKKGARRPWSDEDGLPASRVDIMSSVDGQTRDREGWGARLTRGRV